MSEPVRKPQGERPNAPVPTNGTARQQQTQPNAPVPTNGTAHRQQAPPNAPVPTNGTAHQQQAPSHPKHRIHKEQVAHALQESGFELSRASRMLGLSEPQLILAIRQLFSPGI